MSRLKGVFLQVEVTQSLNMQKYDGSKEHKDDTAEGIVWQRAGVDERQKTGSV